MIEFDDAGIGCTILGEVYVARRVETDEWVSVFRDVREKNPKPMVEVLVSMLHQLQPKEHEIISLCRGQVFDQFEQQLNQTGFVVTRDKITGKTDELAEKQFADALYAIGLPTSLSLQGKNYGLFYHSVHVWYEGLYEGACLLKHKSTKRKKRERDYQMNRACHHPHLLQMLFA